jgi:hypothetical protein
MCRTVMLRLWGTTTWSRNIFAWELAHPLHGLPSIFPKGGCAWSDSVPLEAPMFRALLTVFLVAQGLVLYAQSDAPKPAYDFSLPREERIKLAESAAPPEISSKATVYLLEHSGYVKVRDGSNGFSCFVDRQNPLNLEPTCFDAEGSATTLLSRFYAEEERAKGKSEEEIKAGIEERYKTGKFQAPRKPGIVYMMSDKGYLLVPGNKLVHLPPHLMFYAPYATDKDIGSPPAAANMPHLIRAGQPDAVVIVLPSGGGH